MSGEGNFIVDGITGAPAFIEQTDRSNNCLFITIFFFPTTLHIFSLVPIKVSRFSYLECGLKIGIEICPKPRQL